METESTALQRTIRAIYLDDLQTEFRRLSHFLSKCLSLDRLPCQIEFVANSEAFRTAIKSRPHVAICDMDLGAGPRQYEGAQLIAGLKYDYPDVIFFLLTGQIVTMDVLATHVPNADLILNKDYVGTEEYDKYVRTAFERLLRRQPVVDVTCEFDLRVQSPKSGKSHLAAPELESLVEQCVFGVDPGVEGTEVERVELSVLPDGLSGSGVYKMRLWSGGRVSMVPSVLKVSVHSRAVAELTNYNKYIKWRLPYLLRVDVLGFGSTGAFGAICYSFAMPGGREPATLMRHLRQGSGEAVDAVLRTVLSSNNKNWYAEVLSSDLDARLYFSRPPYYRRNSSRQEREAIFRKMLDDLAQRGGFRCFLGDSTFQFGDTSFQNVHKCVFGRDWGIVDECVCHGDLHGGNILYTGERDELAVIDFQQTGFHHLFRDFISFESSIRLEYPDVDVAADDTQFLKVLTGERELLARGWNRSNSANGYSTQIAKVREAASSNFPGQRLELYVLANTIQSLWLLERSSKWERYKQRRLLAAVLAGIEFLQRA